LATKRRELFWPTEQPGSKREKEWKEEERIPGVYISPSEKYLRNMHP